MSSNGSDAEDVVRREYEAAGWLVLRNGAPDFLATRSGSNNVQVVAIEVKRGGRAISKEQRMWKDIIERAGVEYRVERVLDDSGTLTAHRPTSWDPRRDRTHRIAAAVTSGMSIHEIARREKITRQSVQYHARRAKSRGLLTTSHDTA